MNDTLANAMTAKIERAALEAATADITTLIFTLESTTNAIAALVLSGTSDEITLAELDMHGKIRQIARDAIAARAK